MKNAVFSINFLLAVALAFCLLLEISRRTNATIETFADGTVKARYTRHPEEDNRYIGVRVDYYENGSVQRFLEFDQAGYLRFAYYFNRDGTLHSFSHE
jgi:hypothetical protein